MEKWGKIGVSLTILGIVAFLFGSVFFSATYMQMWMNLSMLGLLMFVIGLPTALIGWIAKK